MKRLLFIAALLSFALLTGFAEGTKMTPGQKSEAKRSKKELKKKDIEREVDSLVVTGNFRFEPVRLIIRNRGDAGSRNMSRSTFFSLHNGWIDSKLQYGTLTNNFKITGCEKENGTWRIDIEARDRIDEIITYEFVVTAKTGAGALRVISNRYAGEYIYSGYLVSN